VEQPEEPAPELPELSLSLVALDGTETVLDESDIAGLSTVEYDGGLMTSSGAIQSLGKYTGVPLSTLYDMIGGITNETTVRITASDGYTAEFDSERIVENNGIILANIIDGQHLPEPYWPLRLVGSEVNKAEMLRNVVEIRLIFEN
jgi:hypothetical protein